MTNFMDYITMCFFSALKAELELKEKKKKRTCIGKLNVCNAYDWLIRVEKGKKWQRQCHNRLTAKSKD